MAGNVIFKQEELDYIRAKWLSESAEDIGLFLGRPTGSVRHKAFSMGLSRMGNGCMVEQDRDDAYMLKVKAELEL